MANQDELRGRLRTLARRILDRDPTSVEEVRLEIRAGQVDVATRSTVRKSIADVLGRTESQVMEKLASHDDSDRIIDEIINDLNRGKGT